MSRIFSGGLTLFVVGVVSLVIIGDVNAGHRRRRRGCCGCAGYAPAPVYYGGGKYGYMNYGYGGRYARQYAPAYYGGYRRGVGGGVYRPGPIVSGGVVDAGQLGPAAGTANAEIGAADRSARLDNRGLTPAQGGIQPGANVDANLGAPNAANPDQGIRSNSDIQRNAAPQGNLNQGETGGAEANSPAPPPVAP